MQLRNNLIPPNPLNVFPTSFSSALGDGAGDKRHFWVFSLIPSVEGTTGRGRGADGRQKEADQRQHGKGGRVDGGELGVTAGSQTAGVVPGTFDLQGATWDSANLRPNASSVPS